MQYKNVYVYEVAVKTNDDDFMRKIDRFIDIFTYVYKEELEKEEVVGMVTLIRENGKNMREV